MRSSDNDVVIVEALRSAVGRRNGGLSSTHPADLLGMVQSGIFKRTGLDPSLVDQVVGACVTAVGEQSYNVTRTAWLAAGLPLSIACSTVDSQCGSSQQATNVAAALVGSGQYEIVMACGVESMSRVPIGSNTKAGPGRAITKSYFERYEFTSQFEGAERIASKWEIRREDADAFALGSQQRAAAAIQDGRFEREVLPITVPDVDEKGETLGSSHALLYDEGIRETSMEKLASLKPVAREDGVHTAGNSSQISDGAAALLLTTAGRARSLGLSPRARIVSQCFVGVDPVLMLTGPIDATHKLLDSSGMTMADIDLFEINEAFASVVLAWERELKAEPDKVNVNGGAIALGHPLGATGARLITTALHELERSDRSLALVAMCCGGGLGTGTIIERVA